MLIKSHAGHINNKTISTNFIMNSLKLQADIIELDVQLTKDNIAIVYHDDLINGCYINQLSYHELCSMTSLLLLKDAFELITPSGKYINLDLKISNDYNTLSEIISQYHYEKKIIISGISLSNLIQLTSHFPLCELWFELNTPLDADNFYKDQKQISDYLEPLIQSGQHNLNIESIYCTDLLIQQAHDKGIRVHVYTVNETSELTHMIELGVDSIATDNLSKLNQLLKSIK